MMQLYNQKTILTIFLISMKNMFKFANVKNIQKSLG